MIQPDSVHIPFFILHYIYIHIYASILTASKFQRSYPPFDFWTVPYHIVCDIYIYIDISNHSHGGPWCTLTMLVEI